MPGPLSYAPLFHDKKACNRNNLLLTRLLGTVNNSYCKEAKTAARSML